VAAGLLQERIEEHLTEGRVQALHGGSLIITFFPEGKVIKFFEGLRQFPGSIKVAAGVENTLRGWRMRRD
jgi:hypothetical protein